MVTALGSRQPGVVRQARAETLAAACSQEMTFGGRVAVGELCSSAMEVAPSCAAEHADQIVDTGWQAMQSAHGN